jgi:ubiquinone biosynthesis protein
MTSVELALDPADGSKETVDLLSSLCSNPLPRKLRWLQITKSSLQEFEGNIIAPTFLRGTADRMSTSRIFRIVETTGQVNARYRLHQEDTPTPLILRRHRQPVPVAPVVPPERFRGWHIMSRFAGYFAQQAVLRLLRRKDKLQPGVRLREILEEFGGLWIKVGQLLSLRTDAFSPEFCRELSRLQHRAIGFPPEIGRALIERELGVPLHRIFSSFDEVPIAAASISQVHEAVLRDGNIRVVVKVQRPNIEQSFAQDMKLLRRLTEIFKSVRFLSYIRWDEALWELDEIMREEVDYRYEAANLRRMRPSLRRHGIYVPRVYEKYCSRKILVMENVPGVLMSDYIHMRDRDPEHLKQWLAENNITPTRVARRLFHSALRQVIEDNLFHADLHPGNIMLLRDSRVALIDFGTIGSLDREFLKLYMLNMRAMAARDYSKAADFMLRLCPELPSFNIVELRAELIRVYRRWEARSYLNNMSYYEKAMTSATTEAGRVMARHRIQVSWRFLRISRTWGTLDASLGTLIPNINQVTLFRSYFKAANRRASRAGGLIARLRGVAEGAADLAQEMDVVYGPALRKRALVLQGTVGKVSRVFTALFRTVKFGLILVLFFLIYTYLFQHHRNIVDPIDLFIFENLARETPEIAFEHWIYFIASVYVFYRLVRIFIRILEKPDVAD